jgi:hypothetical protein
VVVRLKDIFVPLVFKANCTDVSKVQPESCHASIVKFHDLLTRLAIDRTSVIPRVVVAQ